LLFLSQLFLFFSNNKHKTTKRGADKKLNKSKGGRTKAVTSNNMNEMNTK
jgi:hypothetical protein